MTRRPASTTTSARARKAAKPASAIDAPGGPDSRVLPTPRFVRAGGRRLRYLSLGSGPDPMLLIHGFGGDLDTWMLNRDALAQDRRVVALDLPGHGYSDKTLASGSLAEYAAAVIDFMDATGLATAHLVGHSMGGAIALTVAARIPGRVRSLSLLAPAGFGPEANAEFLHGYATAMTRPAIKALLAELFANPAFISSRIVDLVLNYKRRVGVAEALNKTILAQFPGDRQGASLRDLVGLRPTQVVWGEADRIIPVKHTEGLPASVPLRILPGVGHILHLEAPDVVNRLIGEFVGGLP